MKIKNLYESYIAYTNDVSAKTKQAFLDLDYRLDAIRALSLNSITIKKMESYTPKVYNLSGVVSQLGPVVYYCLNSMLLRNFKKSDTLYFCELQLSYNNTPYTLSYSGDTKQYSGYPTPDGFSELNKYTLDDILKFRCILQPQSKMDVESIDNIIKYYIDSVFISNITAELTSDTKVYFDIIFNKKGDVTSDVLTQMDHAIAKKQEEVNKLSTVILDLDAKRREVKLKIKEYENKYIATSVDKHDLASLEAEANALPIKKEKIVESQRLIDEAMPLIKDKLFELHQQGVTNDAVEIKDLLARKKYIEDMANSYIQELKSIELRGDEIVNLIDQRRNRVDVEGVSKKLNDLVEEDKILAIEYEKANAQLVELVSDLDVLKKQMYTESNRLNTLKYVQELNYDKTNAALSAPVFNSSDTHIMNFIYLLYKYTCIDVHCPDVSDNISILNNILNI